MASSPRILNKPTDSHPTRHEAMQKARLAVHRRSACSGVKALRNTSAARRHAAKALLPFRSLAPFRALREPIAGDGMKNGFPAPNKEPTTNQKHHLTGKAPYRFESRSLQRRVCKPSVPRAAIITAAQGKCSPGQIRRVCRTRVCGPSRFCFIGHWRAGIPWSVARSSTGRTNRIAFPLHTVELAAGVER